LKIFTIGGPYTDESKEGVAEIGSELVVCTDGFPAKGKVSVEATGPSGRTLRSNAPSGPDFYRGATIELLPGLPTGAYTVTAKLGAARANGRFTLKNASRPGLRVIRHALHPGDKALVIGVGLPRDARVDVYRKEAAGPPNYGRYSNFVSSFPARPRADGTSTMLIGTPRSAPADCWWLVVNAHGLSAEDELCDP
jgi:hypothetical protein